VEGRHWDGILARRGEEGGEVDVGPREGDEEEKWENSGFIRIVSAKMVCRRKEWKETRSGHGKKKESRS